MLDLAATSALLRLLSDPTRVRLLALLEREELTVAELSAVLRLAQPRVSTHLAKLKEAGLVRDRRAGVSSYYRYNNEIDPRENALLLALKESVDDALLRDDEARLPAVLAKRARAEGWADTVAGDMERHYSPGRTWEALARGMLQLRRDRRRARHRVGRRRARRTARAARALDRLRRCERARGRRRARTPEAASRTSKCAPATCTRSTFRRSSFDLVLLMHALTYSEKPAQAVAEAARVLRKGGRLLAMHARQARAPHRGRAVRPPQPRLQAAKELREFARAAKLEVVACERLTRERRPPHFEV